MRREYNILALLKGKEQYVFVYDDGAQDLLINALRDHASDPQLSFTWFDATVLTDKAREQACGTLPSPSHAQPRSRL